MLLGTGGKGNLRVGEKWEGTAAWYGGWHFKQGRGASSAGKESAVGFQAASRHHVFEKLLLNHRPGGISVARWDGDRRQEVPDTLVSTVEEPQSFSMATALPA